jgi:FkbM family methyltransferase
LRIEPRFLALRARSLARRLLRGGASLAAEPPGPLFVPLPTGEIAALSREAFEAACRAAASPVYVGCKVGLCRIMARYKFYVSTLDDGFGSNVLLDGYWESWLTQFMARNAKPGAVAIDVGANFGYYSLLLADLVGPEGRLFAIEPNPDVAALLRRSIALNGLSARTSVFEGAAGAIDGATVTLFVPEREPKNAAIVADSSEAAAGRHHRVPAMRLDSLVGDARVDFVKIDAEGAEEDVIEGMAGIFERCRPDMVLEFNAARYADPAAFLDRLLSLYGGLSEVGHDGRAAAVTREQVLTEHFGEDWLLWLTRS